MIDLVEQLAAYPRDREILLSHGFRLTAADIEREVERLDLSAIPPNTSVALVGDFDPVSIATLIALIRKGCVVVALSADTRTLHDYFLAAAAVRHVVENGVATALPDPPNTPPLMRGLIERGVPGLVTFSSGTSGAPKASLHDLGRLLSKFVDARKSLRTIAFLKFDHLGGLNTFFYSLFAGGQIVVPGALDPESVFRTVERHKAELLPTSPTFLRLALRIAAFSRFDLSSLKLITYGTEVMDEPTLGRLTRLLPGVDFRQTYGSTELGVLSIRGRSRGSLQFKIGGEGVVTRVIDDILVIRAPLRMLGYLNAPSPFDDEGFYNTGDLVERDGEWLRIVGRDSETVNIGGLKVTPFHVEEAAYKASNVLEAHAFGRPNPLTGQHLELDVVLERPDHGAVGQIRGCLRRHLPESWMPARIRIVEDIPRSRRFKRQGAVGTTR